MPPYVRIVVQKSFKHGVCGSGGGCSLWPVALINEGVETEETITSKGSRNSHSFGGRLVALIHGLRPTVVLRK